MENGKIVGKRKDKSLQESDADDSSENEIEDDDDVVKVDDDSSICSTSLSETVSRYTLAKQKNNSKCPKTGHPGVQFSLLS